MRFELEREEVESLSAYFSELEDPRIERCKKHDLHSIVMIAICGVICSADGWIEIEAWAKAKKDILGEFMELPNGIPSHDTFARVFSRLNPKKFQECFGKWLQSLRLAPAGGVIAIDGKTLRGSYDRAIQQAPLHCVSAWASSSGVSLGSISVRKKSNEITAIPELLEYLEVQGCVVTLDAMGCQKTIAAKIIEKKADYVLMLKENHKNFYKEVSAFFEAKRANGFEDSVHSFTESTDGGHGRIEVRRCWSVASSEFEKSRQEQWKDLRSISMVEGVRSVVDPASGELKTSTEVRFFISSLPADAPRIAKAVRQHWAIENSLHWVLDVTFNEDKSRIRKDKAAENFSMLRKIAISLLKNAENKLKSIKGRRKLAGWDDRFFLNVVFGVKLQ